MIALLTLGWSAAATAQTAPPLRAGTLRLELYWIDPLSALPFHHRLVGDRVEEAMGQLGVAVEWSPAQPESVTSGRDLRIVLLGQDRSAATRSRGVVGAVHRDPKARTVWVLLPTLRRALGIEGAGRPTRAADLKRLAHAIARVVVHEVFHLVVPEHPHTQAGLMRAHYLYEDLLAPIRLEPRLGSALVAALTPPSPPPTTPALLPASTLQGLPYAGLTTPRTASSDTREPEPPQ